MNAMAPPRPTESHRCRLCLTAGPAAVPQARHEVRAVLRHWDVPVDPDVAVLLTSELLTNAVRHEAGRTVTLAVSCSRGQLRVDVYDTSCHWPVPAEPSADAEAGRGLMLVASLSADWGFYRTAQGKAVYFALDFDTDPAPPVPARADRPQAARADRPQAVPAQAVPASRSARRDGAKS